MSKLYYLVVRLFPGAAAGGREEEGSGRGCIAGDAWSDVTSETQGVQCTR